jgi:predicted dehydrogenase
LHPAYEVIGSTGRIEVPDMFSGTLVRITTGQGETRVVEFEDANRFKVQIEHFSDCILNAKPVMFPPEDAKKNTAVLVALNRAARLGRAVEV